MCFRREKVQFVTSAEEKERRQELHASKPARSLCVVGSTNHGMGDVYWPFFRMRLTPLQWQWKGVSAVDVSVGIRFGGEDSCSLVWGAPFQSVGVWMLKSHGVAPLSRVSAMWVWFVISRWGTLLRMPVLMRRVGGHDGGWMWYAMREEHLLQKRMVVLLEIL